MTSERKGVRDPTERVMWPPRRPSDFAAEPCASEMGTTGASSSLMSFFCSICTRRVFSTTCNCVCSLACVQDGTGA